MVSRVELGLFYAAVGAVLAVPLVVGPVAGFGGLEGMAWLFGAGGPIAVPIPVRSGLRAIAFLFAALVPLTIWSLARLAERAGAFRIVVVCGFLSGFARLAGYVVDGDPGVVSMVFLIIELAGMPGLFLWHRRLVASSRGNHKLGVSSRGTPLL